MSAVACRLAALIGGLFFLGCCAPSASAGNCDDPLPRGRSSGSPIRTVTPMDLVKLRDIGPSIIDDPTAQMFAISPDGRRIAFQMQQADVATNSYCMSLVVKSLRPVNDARVLDTGGEFIKRTFSFKGFALGVPSGVGLETAPVWSPDGRQIAYLRRDHGITQVWVVSLDSDSGVAKPLTRLITNVEALAWTPDGKRIVISTRHGLAAFKDQITAEGIRGFHYDDRWLPAAFNWPQAREPMPASVQSVEVATGDVSRASAEDAHLLTRPKEPQRPDKAIVFSAQADGQFAWTSAISDTGVLPKTFLSVQRQGRVSECRETVCNGIIALWWDRDAVVVLRRDAQSGNMGVYRWSVGMNVPEPILTTISYLTGCQHTPGLLFCREEASQQPGRLISIDLRDGNTSIVYDPNPEFRSLRLGSVERIFWSNDYKVETWGDLVLPPDYVPGERLPLIIVQYTSVGFLRGGTGDEFPIQVFAAHGFAVLSVQRPQYIGISKGAKSWDDVNRLDMADWADRRSILSSFETVVHLLDDRGIIDPNRVGLTGLSDGASSAQFGVLNSHLFRTVAISQCCEEESSPMYLAGPALQPWHRGNGYPTLTEDGRAFWAPMSFRANAARMNTPLLMQLSDIEYLAALEGYMALKEQNKPVDMYVFPDENHVKWQPAHRFAAYTRYVDWFDYWLNNIEDPDPSKSRQYGDWSVMKGLNGS